MGNRHVCGRITTNANFSVDVAAAMLFPAAAVHAQENPTYKVDFTIRDTGDAGGKTGRKYSLLVNRKQKTVFKVGNRVPVATGGSGNNALVNTQFTYIDVGLNIECMVDEAGSKFAVHADMDISTAVMPEKARMRYPIPPSRRSG